MRKNLRRKIEEGRRPQGVKQFLRLCVVLWGIVPLTVYGGNPLDAVQKQVNSVLETLRDSSLKGDAGKEAKKRKVRKITGEMFAFEEVSRRTLGPNWERLDPVQRREFTDLYREVLEDAYMEKILAYTNEKILFTGERILDRGQAEVMTKVVTKAAEIPIEYRLLENAGDWKVYDVVIEGVSLVKNYRAQFRDILAKKSVEEMLDVLRKRVKKE